MSMGWMSQVVAQLILSRTRVLFRHSTSPTDSVSSMKEFNGVTYGAARLLAESWRGRLALMNCCKTAKVMSSLHYAPASAHSRFRELWRSCRIFAALLAFGLIVAGVAAFGPGLIESWAKFNAVRMFLPNPNQSTCSKGQPGANGTLSGLEMTSEFQKLKQFLIFQGQRRPMNGCYSFVQIPRTRKTFCLRCTTTR